MREFRQVQGRAGERYWIIDLVGDTVVSSWGAIKDGEHKSHGCTSDIPGPKGKVGTKAFVDDEANARFEHDRAIRKKTEEGYVEVGIDGRPLIGGSADEINHDRPLPKNLCFSKPTNKVSDEKIKKLSDEGKLLYTRKVNGMMVIAQIMTDGEIRLYSRRMDNLTDHFPHLVGALEELKVPPQSILLFEAFMGEGNDKRDMALCGSIMRSKFDVALRKQQENSWMKFYLFRLPFLDGEHLEGKYSNQALIETIENAFADRFLEYEGPVSGGGWLSTILSINGDATEVMDIADYHGWEGWVVYVKDDMLGDKSYSFNGKPDRPSCCFKMKRSQEDDFIAYFDPDQGTKERPLGTWGSGKNKERIGTLSLYQLNSAGDEVYISEVGSGLSDEDRDALMLKTMKNKSPSPIVVQVEFDERLYLSSGDKTNALQLPRVVQVRNDKKPRECVNTEL